jgi:hypothetical protein
MLLATINSSIILIALDIFRRIHLDPLTPANTNYLLRTTACLLVGCASVLSPDLTESETGRLVWSVYGAQRAQSVATDRRRTRPNPKNRPNPLPSVASRCR